MPRDAVLLAAPLPEFLSAPLADRYDVVQLPAPGNPARADAIAAIGRDLPVAVTTSRFGLGGEEMAQVPGLRAIASFGVGYDSIDVAAAGRLAVAVANTPDVLTDAVADLAVGLVIDSMRRMSAGDRFVRSGAWADGKEWPLATQVTGARVGIVGLGRIGRAIADRLAGFRCRVGYHNRHRADVDLPWFASAAELAAWSDVLVLAAPGGGRPIIGAAELEALGPAGHLVNIGRGSLVDEPALVRALTSGTIAGAGLDVFADEPHVPTELFGLDNVVVVPHIASATVQTRQAMADLVLDNVSAWFDTGAFVTPVA